MCLVRRPICELSATCTGFAAISSTGSSTGTLSTLLTACTVFCHDFMVSPLWVLQGDSSYSPRTVALDLSGSLGGELATAVHSVPSLFCESTILDC
jgi:hypothetical protein